MSKMQPFWYFKPPPPKVIAYIEMVLPSDYPGMWPAVDDISLITISPEEERMVNGGLETGDFTGYTVAEDKIVTWVVHTGSYAARLYAVDGNYLRQTFDTPIPVANVKSLTFWGCTWYQYYPFVNVMIGYTDGTKTVISVGATCVGGWEQWDLTSYLGKNCIEDV